jgi:outer membrane protein assembly factor BamE (lipoprotein component of BamABCDE complex)
MFFFSCSECRERYVLLVGDAELSNMLLLNYGFLKDYFMKKLIVAALAVVLAACTAVQSGTQVSADTVKSFEKGVTTSAQVRAALGDPMNVHQNGDGTELWTYYHTETKTNGAEYIPIAGLFMTEAKTKSTTAQMSFSAEGILQDVNYSESNFNTK